MDIILSLTPVEHTMFYVSPNSALFTVSGIEKVRYTFTDKSSKSFSRSKAERVLRRVGKRKAAATTVCFATRNHRTSFSHVFKITD